MQFDGRNHRSAHPVSWVDWRRGLGVTEASGHFIWLIDKDRRSIPLADSPMAAGPGAGRTPRRIDALTGVRFLAAALVLVFHYGATYIARAGAPPFVGNFLHHGYLGVSLFFTLSGFILTY